MVRVVNLPCARAHQLKNKKPQQLKSHPLMTNFDVFGEAKVGEKHRVGRLSVQTNNIKSQKKKTTNNHQAERTSSTSKFSSLRSR
jgi:translation elongation factor EF-1alpha